MQRVSSWNLVSTYVHFACFDGCGSLPPPHADAGAIAGGSGAGVGMDEGVLEDWIAVVGLAAEWQASIHFL
jgi:hypothetical protein